MFLFLFLFLLRGWEGGGVFWFLFFTNFNKATRSGSVLNFIKIGINIYEKMDTEGS